MSVTSNSVINVDPTRPVINYPGGENGIEGGTVIGGGSGPPPFTADLILFDGNVVNAVRPGWESINKTTGAFSDLPAVTNGVAQILVGPRWQPSGNYAAGSFSSTAPRTGIFKRTGLTNLDRLTVGVPAWSSFKTGVCWDGDDRLLSCGEVATFVEVATRSGDTFTNLASPLSVQSTINVFGIDALNGFMVTNAENTTSINIRTYQWNGSNQYTQGNTYDIAASHTGRKVAISPDGNWVAAFGTTFPGSVALLRVYSRSGTVLTQVHANLLTGSGGSGDICFSKDSRFLYFQSATGTTAAIQGWMNIAGTWTPITLGISLTDADGAGVSVSPDNALLAVGQGSGGTSRVKTYLINQSTGALTLGSSSANSSGTGAGVTFTENLT